MEEIRPRGAETELARLDLVDRVEVATAESRKRALWSGVFTLAAPVNFLIQARFFWSGGWPEAGIVGLGFFTLFAAGMWAWWYGAASQRRRARRELAELELALEAAEDGKAGLADPAQPGAAF